MNCREFDSLLNEHAHEALGSAERRELNAHLASCQRCAEAWWAYETMRAEVPPVPEAALLDRISQALGREAPRARPVSSGNRWASVTGIAAVLAIAAFALVLTRSVDRADGPSDSTSASSSPESGDLDRTGSDAMSRRLVETSASGNDGVDADIAGLAGRFVEGRDYLRIVDASVSASAADRIEIAEIFMYGCFPCFAFDSTFAQWSSSLGDDVEVVRIPAIWNAASRVHAQAYYAALQLGVAEAVHVAFLEEIHLRGNALVTVSELAAFFDRFGVEPARLRRELASDAVAAAVAEAETLVRRYRVDATPSIVVNGKYLTTGPMAGSYERWLAIVDALVESERSGARASSGGSGGVESPRCDARTRSRACVP